MRWTAASGLLVVFVLVSSILVPMGPSEDRDVAGALYAGPEYWGTAESFSNITTGTHGPSIANDVTIIGLTDPWGNQTSDTVVLDGWLYEMTFSDSQGTMMWYEPSGPLVRTDDWNLSIEVTRTKESSAYESFNLSVQAGRQTMQVFLSNETYAAQAGIAFVTGSPLNEAIQLYDPVGVTWTTVSSDMRPAFPHDSDAYGLRPDRYIVSFAHANNSPEVTVTVTNSGTGVVYSGNTTIPSASNILWPKLRVDMDVDTGSVGTYAVSTGWIIDNLMFRSMQSRHPIIEPVYEFVEASDPVWVSVTDISGSTIADAIVSIEGMPASFNAATSRYEVLATRPVDWDVKYNYTVVADGVHIADSVYVSTTIDSLPGVEISRWWNGWDWASVFGRDDSSEAISADLTYKAFDHPTTSYMSSAFGGNSTQILERQSEIAIHYPHEWRTWGHSPWTTALMNAEAGQEMLDDKYDFASRWDDPRYVGIGDTYISMANPGNTASWEMMFAQYQTGTRIMGTSSWTYLGGNSSLLGSYWINVPADSWITPWGPWHPHQSMDLMDMLRSVNTDSDNPYQLETIQITAENQGVVRFYNHNTIANATLLRWVTQQKNDFPYENWKATDGEVASYIHGRWSTDVKLDASSTGEVWVYDVSRQDPTVDGYWRVPVTVSFDITERKIDYVRIVSGTWDLNSSDGSLQNLNKSRQMDIGYDIRGDRLYVSYFWNESSQIIIGITQADNPRILSEGVSQGYSYSEYSSVINCTTPDDGPSVWALETDASWLSIESSSDTVCVVSGTTESWGVYYANLTVSDDNNTSYLNWTIAMTRLKVVSGYVLNETNGGIAGLDVLITVMDGPASRTVTIARTDENGFYSVNLTNDEWFLNDDITLSGTYDSRTEENSTVADAAIAQELNLQFVPMIPEFGIVKIALVAASVAAIVTAVALIWRRRRSLRDA